MFQRSCGAVILFALIGFVSSAFCFETLHTWSGAPTAWVGPVPPAFVHRRELVASAPAILAATSLLRQGRRSRLETPSGLGGGVMNFPVIDSACHVWVDDPKYPFAKQPAGATPWTQGGAAEPASAEMLLKLMDDNGVDKTVLIQPICYAFDNSYVLDCVKRWPDRFSAVARIDPEDVDAPLALEKVAASGAVGVRFGPVQRLWWETSLMGEILDKASSLGLPVLLFLGKGGGNTLDWVAPIIRRHPQTQFVIDHMGDVAPSDERQVTALLALAELSNVYVKVSHTWAIGTEREYPWADGLALARRVVSAFGTKRSMFATDWPVCTRPVWPGGGATYDQVVRLAQEELLDSKSGELLGGTASALFFSDLRGI